MELNKEKKKRTGYQKKGSENELEFDESMLEAELALLLIIRHRRFIKKRESRTLCPN